MYHFRRFTIILFFYSMQIKANHITYHTIIVLITHSTDEYNLFYIDMPCCLLISFILLYLPTLYPFMMMTWYNKCHCIFIQLPTGMCFHPMQLFYVRNTPLTSASCVWYINTDWTHIDISIVCITHTLLLTCVIIDYTLKHIQVFSVSFVMWLQRWIYSLMNHK